jgi:hypothetical protein
VFLVKIDKKDNYQSFKASVESNERAGTPGKPWTDYQRPLASNVENFPHSMYCGRRSRVYNLPAKQLQRYFEERTNDIEELEEKLNAWHERNFPLLEDTSATFYAYGWSVSENGNLEIREIGREVYYPADSSQISSTSSLKITTYDLFGHDKTAIEDNTVSIGDKTVAVPLPIKDLRARIDRGIEEHIANTIRKLVRELQDEYSKWKQGEHGSQPPPHSSPFDEHPQIPL